MSDAAAISERPFTIYAWNHYLAEGRLMGSYCPDSGKTYVPPRAICPETHSSNMQWVELSGKGTLAAFTSIAIGPIAMLARGYGRDNPYVSGIVQLAEGPMISALILGFDAKQPDINWIGTALELDIQPGIEGSGPILGFKVAG